MKTYLKLNGRQRDIAIAVFVSPFLSVTKCFFLGCEAPLLVAHSMFFGVAFKSISPELKFTRFISANVNEITIQKMFR